MRCRYVSMERMCTDYDTIRIHMTQWYCAYLRSKTMDEPGSPLCPLLSKIAVSNVSSSELLSRLLLQQNRLGVESGNIMKYPEMPRWYGRSKSLLQLSNFSPFPSSSSSCSLYHVHFIEMHLLMFNELIWKCRKLPSFRMVCKLVASCLYSISPSFMAWRGFFLIAWEQWFCGNSAELGKEDVRYLTEVNNANPASSLTRILSSGASRRWSASFEKEIAPTARATQMKKVCNLSR